MKAIEQELEGFHYWEEKKRAQREYCKKYNLPMFFPSNGFCYFCGKNIFNEISYEEAKTEHIIKCPLCDRSFAE